MQKRFIVVLVIVVALGAAALYAYRNLRRPASNLVAISGNIEMTEVSISFKTAGKLMERTVDEGDPVKQGQVIARLDRDQLLRQRDREQAGLSAATAQLAQAETAVNWQRATLSADIEQRRADLAAQEARLAELRNGSRPQEKLDARAVVDAAAAEVERARRDWDRAQTLFKNDDISAAQYDQYRRTFETASANLKSARERESLVLAGPRQETIDNAAAQVDRARAALKLAEANSIELKRREQEIAARHADIERSRAAIALIDSQLADTIAYSPVDGLVLVKAADVGEVLAPGTSVVTVGDIDHPWLRGYIPETELGRVKIGSKVKVTTDSYPGKTYSGRVGFISSEAEFTPKQIQTREERVKLVYRVKIDLENPKRELKSNMPADAEIVVE